jgi:hypothetical protein
MNQEETHILGRGTVDNQGTGTVIVQVPSSGRYADGLRQD